MMMQCAGCQHSYDVSGYQSGQRLRCHCGQILVVPEENPRLKAARAFHCSNCGGHLEPDKPSCGFCGAMIDLTDTRLTAYCAACLSMSKSGAKFCSECGAPMTTKLDVPEEIDESCPRCSLRLRRRHVGHHRVSECPVCCGIFVDVDDLEAMIDKQQESVPSRKGGTTGRAERAQLMAQPVTYLKCARCGTLMNRVNYGRSSGVIIDYCKHHGYWLDDGELSKIAKWVTTGGLVEQTTREIEELKSQKSRLAYQTVTPAATLTKRGGFIAKGGFDLFDLLSHLFD